MCYQTTCKSCGKPTWAGCGQHVEQALADVPRAERCACHDPTAGLPNISDPSKIKVRIAFTGGLELLFQKRRSLELAVPPGTKLQDLILQLRKECDKKKEQLFIQNETVRPGILVLINESDWELEGEGEYIVQDKDEILFVSTLHGG